MINNENKFMLYLCLYLYLYFQSISYSDSEVYYSAGVIKSMSSPFSSSSNISSNLLLRIPFPATLLGMLWINGKIGSKAIYNVFSMRPGMIFASNILDNSKQGLVLTSINQGFKLLSTIKSKPNNYFIKIILQTWIIFFWNLLSSKQLIINKKNIALDLSKYH